MTDPITHMKSLIYEREIEEKRKFYEEIAREDDPTAVTLRCLEVWHTKNGLP